MRLSIVLSTQPAKFEALAYSERSEEQGSRRRRGSYKGEFERNVTEIARLGYNGVELAVRDPSLLNADEIAQVIKRCGLEVPAVGTGQAYGEEGLSFTDPDKKVRQRAVKRIKDQVEFTRSFGALVIIGLIAGKVQEGVEREQAVEWLAASLAECTKHAAPDVRLVLEPINRYETNLINNVAQGLKLIERVGAENFGLLFDTFHANIEESSIEESIRAAGDRIFHVHVADSNRWYPGAGHIDFSSIISTLHEIGYDGYLSAEILPMPDADTCAKRAITTLRHLDL